MASFNPRARDGREIGRGGWGHPFCCFNPRARDGREAYDIAKSRNEPVSIHAPVMDAKIYLAHTLLDFMKYVSIHAPVMDANRAFMQV